MIEIVLSTLILSLGGLGYFTIYRLTGSNDTKSSVILSRVTRIETEILILKEIVAMIELRIKDMSSNERKYRLQDPSKK